MTARLQLLQTVASEIEEMVDATILRVGIDGVDGAGKTYFADELAAQITSLPVIRASVDFFHNPRAVRYSQGKDSPVGFFEDSYNYQLFKEYLLDPLSPNGSLTYRTKAFDHTTDRPVESPAKQISLPSILIVDGIFLHRPELVNYWDYSLFLKVSTGESVRRCEIREGIVEGRADPDDPKYRRYVQGQAIYLSQCNPELQADRVVDNEHLDSPFFVR